MLNKDLHNWLEGYNQIMKDLVARGFTPSPKSARDGLATMTRSLVTISPPVATIVQDTYSSGDYPINVRLYHPSPDKKLPIFLYLHGGGHMGGSIRVYDPILRKLALQTNRIIVAPEYRLAPEYPYPIGLTDSLVIAENILEILRKNNMQFLPQIALGGDSAGGALSATIALNLHRYKMENIDHLVLIYPSLDYTLSQESTTRLAKGYLLETERIEWYFHHYFQNNEDRKKVSPLYMDIPDSFPPTFIGTAQYCPLRDEALVFADKVRKNSGLTVVMDYEGVLHAFMNMEDLNPETCRRLYSDIADFLNSSQ